VKKKFYDAKDLDYVLTAANSVASCLGLNLEFDYEDGELVVSHLLTDYKEHYEANKREAMSYLAGFMDGIQQGLCWSREKP